MEFTTNGSDGLTPLHKAAWKGHAAVVQHLLGGDADADLKDGGGLTALDLAKSAERAEVVSLLTSDE